MTYKCVYTHIIFFFFCRILYSPVADSDAVTDELTMMVEMLDAPVAQSTVFGPQRSYATARVTQSGQYVFFGSHVARKYRQLSVRVKQKYCLYYYRR